MNHSLNHNHQSDLQKLSRQVVSNSCKRKAVDDICQRPSKIINMEVSTSLYKENLITTDLERIRHNINRNRLSANMSATPKNIREVHEALDVINVVTDRNEPFLLLNDIKSNIVIFSTTSNLNCLSQCQTFYMDGTFKYCAKFFFQLFSIHGLRNGHYIPLVFCLLPNKQVATYITLFNSLLSLSNDQHIFLNPQKIVVDYEMAIHNSVQSVWPTAKIFGCRFHLAQSWYRKIQSLGLVSIYKGDTEHGKWLQHLFGLPFLDPDRVGECFTENFMADLPQLNSFTKLADYLVDNYITEHSSFPPSIWASKTSSLFLTTNPCESFHSHFSKIFYHTHPNIHTFVKTLTEYQCLIYIKIQSVNIPVTVKTKRVREAENFLSQKILELDSKRILEYDYVKLVCHRYKI